MDASLYVYGGAYTMKFKGRGPHVGRVNSWTCVAKTNLPRQVYYSTARTTHNTKATAIGGCRRSKSQRTCVAGV